MSDVNLHAIAESRVDQPLNTWPEHNKGHSSTLMGNFLWDFHCLRCWLEKIASEKLVASKKALPVGQMSLLDEIMALIRIRADMLEDKGSELVEGYRWLAQNGRFPQQCWEKDKKAWTWGENVSGNDSCFYYSLPTLLCNHLGRRPIYLTAYDRLEDAYDAAALAFFNLSDREKSKLTAEGMG